MQLALRRVNGYLIRRCAYEDLNSVISINLKTLPEHYTEYFFESLLREIPEAFIIAEINNNGSGLYNVQIRVWLLEF